ncbi:MAG: uracil-DNA glycosylase [Burkholderiaceae bacterium]
MDASWRGLLGEFLASDAGKRLAAFVQSRIDAGAVVYPPDPFRMLALTPLSCVKVVILGQDPYHGPGQAEGLAFSVSPGVAVPPSLRNILKEVMTSHGESLAHAAVRRRPVNGSLVAWAEQGVLLLNTCLTVEDGSPASHARQGWEALTTSILVACNDAPGAKVFMLWGAHAQSMLPVIDQSRHLVLTANHPSPLSATRGPSPFLGCGHFVKANEWLAQHFESKIDWLGKCNKTVA